ncbi:zinc-binding alcohol dehydrogenase family protein [Sphingomonas sp. CFBP 8760]|uniref:zinc-binding alcohol dehydrogenase family protein n=1 Tax=Sphingomonas sp. CFBP 8760 TaxID=2775282 RepID=UPI0017825E19|nr:zinc-binding alcohol dehydrogenase family protein [Sphingomonas sp. CFBP 8760]MBD8548903.1 zinc-binding alcohol dehydrogenase family protein [Sphingomonas sp. CFBP 8760]
MKTIVCERPLHLAVHERPIPLRGPGEVLVRIRRVGICGTDYHIFGGNQPYLDYPRVMGHELAATVEEADADADLAPGDVITILPYLACDECIACRRGKPNCCTHLQVLGVHRDGGMAEYLSVPRAAVVPVQDLSLDQAAMVEFLAIGAHAVRRAGVIADARILVVGAGPIGVATALFARQDGARVTLADTDADRLDQARRLTGIADTVLVDDVIACVLASRTDGEFFDVVFDATGSARAIEAGFGYVAHGGTYVLVSIVKAQIAFSDPEFHKRETTLMGSRNATSADFRHVIASIRAGLIPTAAMHTQSFPLVEAAEYFPQLIAGQGSVLKAIATW